MKNNSIILKNFKSHGLRNTKVRKTMLSLFNSYRKPMSVDELHQYIPNVNKTTIYRQLKTFEYQKVLKRIDLKDGLMRYERNNMEHHHHIICNVCRKITDVKLKNDFMLENQIIHRNNNYLITEHILEFFGICPDCRN